MSAASVDGPPAEGDDLRRRGFRGRLVVQEVERHVGPGLGEPDGDGAPDAALGARHEDDLAGAPLVGVHGGKVYHIPALPIGRAKKWPDRVAGYRAHPPGPCTTRAWPAAALARCVPVRVLGVEAHHIERGERLMRKLMTSMLMATLVAGVCLTGCEKGPLQKAGEKVDEVTGNDKVIGKGPAEMAGRKIDNTVDPKK